jgi:hypothetical protein
MHPKHGLKMRVETPNGPAAPAQRVVGDIHELVELGCE